MAQNTVCLWFDNDAAEAARFYCETFPGSTLGAVQFAPSDFPSGKAGDPLLIEFTVLGILCRAQRWPRVQAQRGILLSSLN